jgi:hypothetical protein
MQQPSGIRLVFARVASLLLLPAGLVCVGAPFYMLTLPERWGIVDDTRAAFGAGADGGRLKATYVGCVRERSGSSSNTSRSFGITEFDCVIDLGEAPEPAPAASDTAPASSETDAEKGYDDFASYEEKMAEFNRRTAEVSRRQAEKDRRYAADLDAFIAQSKARSDTSSRIERTLATDRSGELPAVRILSAQGESRRVGLVWGAGEIAFRWVHWLVTSLLFFSFGGACLFAVWLAWRSGVPRANEQSP